MSARFCADSSSSENFKPAGGRRFHSLQKCKNISGAIMYNVIYVSISLAANINKQATEPLL